MENYEETEIKRLAAVLTDCLGHVHFQGEPWTVDKGVLVFSSIAELDIAASPASAS